ncbi:MAG: hypothetical protein L0212_11250 [Acidobacteria bacterium]|nr:hypothetical protein [Acidobacteriota bacterium]
MTVGELRPLSLGELLDRTFSLYRSHFWLFIGLTAIPYLILLGPGLLIDSAQLLVPGSPVLAGLTAGLLTLLVALGTLIAYGLTQAATVFAVSEVYLGRSISIREAYSRVYGDIGRVIFVLILVGVGIFVGAILLVIPGIWFFLRSCISVMPAVLEDKPAVEAIRRAMELTKGSLGRVFVVWLLFFAITIVAGILFQWVPVTIAVMTMGDQAGPVLVLIPMILRVGGSLANIIAGPLLTIGLSLLYFDLRMRKEAFDLTLMMDQLGRGSAPVGTPRLDGLGS